MKKQLLLIAFIAFGLIACDNSSSASDDNGGRKAGDNSLELKIPIVAWGEEDGYPYYQTFEPFCYRDEDDGTMIWYDDTLTARGEDYKDYIFPRYFYLIYKDTLCTSFEGGDLEDYHDYSYSVMTGNNATIFG